MATHFSGPVVSTNGFEGAVTGDITGAVIQAPTAHASDGAISPDEGVANLNKATAGAYTLAAPGAANVGKRLLVYSGTAQAHVVTVTGLTGGNTQTFAAAIGNNFELYAASATLWVRIGTQLGVTLSTV